MAMSPRLLRPRASGAFSPSQLSGLLRWYDASDATTVTLNGTSVSSLKEKSGLGVAATQSTAAQQPSYVTSVKNGKNAMQFGGDPSGHMLTFSQVTFPQSYTAFFVFERPTTGVRSVGLGGLNKYPLLWNTDNALAQWSSSSFTLHGSSSATGWFVAVTRRTAGVSVTLALNGVPQTAALSGGGVTETAMDNFKNLGSNNSLNMFHTGYWGETFIYNRALSDSEIAAVESALKKKWGI